jgi:hypothetical protein
MSEHSANHPLTSLPGVLTIAAWALYVLSAVLYYPEFPPSVLVTGGFGIAACLAVAFNFKYWRAVVVLACSLHLVLYVIRVIRMTGLTTDASFLSAVSFYYSASWSLAASMFQEKGLMGGLTHAFLEFVMPVLMVALIAIALASRRRKPGVSRAG